MNMDMMEIVGQQLSDTPTTADQLHQAPEIRLTTENQETTNIHPESQQTGRESNERNQEDSLGVEDRNGRRTIYSRSLSAIIASRGVTVTFAHACMGVVLIAVGCVVRPLLSFKPPTFEVHSATHFGVIVSNISNQEMTRRNSQQNLFKQPNNQMYPVGIGEFYCDAITCNPHLPLFCIGVGCVFIFCAFSTGLMVYYKMKEYVCCHLVWISLSALCSITFAAACLMGLKSAYEKGMGVASCTCVLIAVTVLEIVFCALDAFNVGTHFISGTVRGDEGQLRLFPWSRRSPTVRDQTDATVEEQRDNLQEENIHVSHRNNSSRQTTQQPDVTMSAPGGNIRGVQLRASTMGTRIRRDHSFQRNGRTRSQRRRVGNFLHPGFPQYGDLTRTRGRRRPILRAQNHYVLVPAPFGRPRTTSRAGRILIGERRNRSNMPMFVIPNHDGYIRAINRTNETHETGFIRSDVADLTSPNPATSVRKSFIKNPSESLMHRNANEKRCSSGKKKSNHSQIPMYEIDDFSELPSEALDGTHVNKRRRDGRPVYSVVRRSKEGTGDERVQNKAVTQLQTTEKSILGTLADKLSLAATAVLDANRKESRHRCLPLGQEKIFGEMACAPPPPTPDSPPERIILGSSNDEAKTNDHVNLYQTSSDGDYSTVSAESIITSDTQKDSNLLVCASSDSGLGDILNNFTKKSARGVSPMYYNVPRCGSKPVSPDSGNSAEGYPRRNLPPVSPRIPAYENVDVSTGSPRIKQNEDSTAFPFLL